MEELFVEEQIPLEPLISSVLLERDAQNTNESVILTFDNQLKSAPAYTKVNGEKFKRIFSNLLNNAYDAIENNNGKIDVSLSSCDENLVQILIKDNGVGISESELAILGRSKIVSKKISGTGIGLLDAQSVLNEWGGKLELKSKLSVGTIVKVILPICRTEPVYVSKLKLSKAQRVVVLDDDKNIHDVWKKKLVNFSSEIEMFYFDNFEELKIFLIKRKDDNVRTQFLIDYQIDGSTESGCDVILDLDIIMESVLVTSLYDDSFLRNKCLKYGIGLIRKPFIQEIAIESI